VFFFLDILLYYTQRYRNNFYNCLLSGAGHSAPKALCCLVIGVV